MEAGAVAPAVAPQVKPAAAQLRHIEKTAELVVAELEANNISIPSDSIKYAKVPVGEPIEPPEAAHDLLRRGTIVKQHLTGQSEI
ncbi:hypothetical protein PENANT_c001G00877 [Penicillium antarcticum]|uniref:Uncharacterized protein n=1 Tax=Penicillium antarcticum TaxID=416450 RepID=A0A1V6QPA6_9EURO|nr:hypothetical protein PENANT_c001G00877 [Penicillium antarcticum]